MAITNKLVPDTEYVELEGVNDDDKPTEGIGINSKFHELDPGDTYYFDGTTWSKIGGE